MLDHLGEKIQNSKILIVEDNESNLQALTLILSLNNYTVLQARNGLEAIQITNIELPDLILLDINMPGIDGYTTCGEIKSNPATKPIPIIFTTALSDIDDIVKGFQAGAVDYITKPIRNAELLARILIHLELVHTRKILEQQNKDLNISESKLLDLAQNLIASNTKLKESQNELIMLKERLVKEESNINNLNKAS